VPDRLYGRPPRLFEGPEARSAESVEGEIHGRGRSRGHEDDDTVASAREEHPVGVEAEAPWITDVPTPPFGRESHPEPLHARSGPPAEQGEIELESLARASCRTPSTRRSPVFGRIQRAGCAGVVCVRIEVAQPAPAQATARRAHRIRRHAGRLQSLRPVDRRSPDHARRRATPRRSRLARRLTSAVTNW
jgi:hypothetical protein